MHDEEAAGYLALGLSSLPVSHWGKTNVAMKECAEGTQTLKTDFEAHVSHAQFVVAEQFFCLLDATLDEVLMGGLVESLAEKSQEVITRKAGLLRNLIEAKRVIVAVVDKTARTIEPLKCFEVGRLSVVDSSNH